MEEMWLPAVLQKMSTEELKQVVKKSHDMFGQGCKVKRVSRIEGQASVTVELEDKQIKTIKL